MRTNFTVSLSLLLPCSLMAPHLELVQALANGSTFEGISEGFVYDWDDVDDESTLEYAVKQERRGWNEFLEQAVGVQSEALEAAPPLDPLLSDRLPRANIRKWSVPLVAATLSVFFLLLRKTSNGGDMSDGVHSAVYRMHYHANPTMRHSERLKSEGASPEGADLSTTFGDGGWSGILERVKRADDVRGGQFRLSWSEENASAASSGGEDGSFDVLKDFDRTPPVSDTPLVPPPASHALLQRFNAWQTPIAGVAVALEEMADGVSTAAQDALTWVREAYHTMQKRHLGSERHIIALPLFTSLSDVTSCVTNNIMVLAVELRNLAESVRRFMESDLPDPTEEYTKMDAFLLEAEALVATAKQHELSLAEAVQKMRIAAHVAAVELKKALELTQEAFSVAARMTAPIPAYLMKKENKTEFYEYVVKEQKLLRDMTQLLKERSVLARTDMFETFHSALEFQSRFVNAAEQILRGEESNGNLRISELKEEANRLKKAVHLSARRILNHLSWTYADNAASSATLGILNPKGVSDWMTVRFVPLAHLTEEMENLASRVVHAVETAKFNLSNLNTNDGEGNPGGSPVEADASTARR